MASSYQSLIEFSLLCPRKTKQTCLRSCPCLCLRNRIAAAMKACSYTDVKLKRTDRTKSISAADENISVRSHNVEVT